MARRTVENFNGFVAARPPAAASKKSVAATTSGRTRHVAAAAPTTTTGATTGSGKKPAATAPIKSRTGNAAARPTAPAPATTKKRESLNARPLAKTERPQRNVTTVRKVPAVNVVKSERSDGQVKSERIGGQVKIKRNEIKIDQRKGAAEKVAGSTKMVDNTTADSLSDVSDDQEYEDDFEDYESDFESDTSIVESSLPATRPAANVIDRPISGGSTKFALPVCVEEKLEPFLDETFEVNSLERTIEMGLKNFQTAGKRKREQEAKEKIQTRGKVLMEMIKLDTVSYTLLDLPAIPYEQYIKMYGRSNMTQVQTQTHDDNAEKEVQTSEIDFADKWTQRPIVLPNGLNCSSPEYLRARLGVGGDGDGSGVSSRLARVVAVDPDRVCAVARTVLSILERQAADAARNRLTANNHEKTGFSDGHLKPAVSAVEFLAKRPVTSVEFARISSESLVTTHEIMDSCYQCLICVWSISNTEHPEYVLKCPNRVTSLCVLHKSTSGFVAAAHDDGSICVWDLRESRLHHQQVDCLSCPLRSPSFNTALSTDVEGHGSKLVGLSKVTYCSRSNDVSSTTNDLGGGDELPDELCSLDEDFVLNVWKVVDSWANASEITRNQNAGTAPWSSVRLVKTQTLKADKHVPRYLSEGVAATCMCLNNNQDAFIGTDSGRIFRCNLGGHKVWPTYYTHEDTGEYFSVNSLDICPFDANYFLAGCSSNGVMLYCSNRQEALKRFFSPQNVSKSPAFVVQAKWCAGIPGIVFGLDSLSTVHLWDLCDDDVTVPKISASFRDRTVTCLSLSAASTRDNGPADTYVGLAFADGTVELHRVKVDKRKNADGDESTGATVNCDTSFTRFLADL